MKFKKCILLLPMKHNDGTEVPAEVMSGVLGDIYAAFDGYTVDGTSDGAYKMDDGSKAMDKSLRVWVAVDPNRVDELRAMASRFAAVLGQESLLFEVTEAEIEFVRPSPTGDVR